MSQQESLSRIEVPNQPLKKRGNRGGSNPARHEALCNVCRHPDKSEIQNQYMRGVSSYVLAKDFHLTPDSIRRHVRYFSLDARRARDEEEVLSFYLARHLDKFLDAGAFSVQAVIKVADLLGKMRGRHHRPPHPDPQFQDKSRFFNNAIDEMILTDGKTEQEARAIFFEQVPEAKDLFGR